MLMVITSRSESLSAQQGNNNGLYARLVVVLDYDSIFRFLLMRLHCPRQTVYQEGDEIDCRSMSSSVSLTMLSQ